VNILNTPKYSVSEFKIKQLIGVELKSKENGIKLVPVEAFELGNFLIDWVRDQEQFTDTDYCTESVVDRALRFEYIDQFSYKIKENAVLVGMATWNNSKGEWEAVISNPDISLSNRYRNELFKEVQVEYDKTEGGK